MEKANINIESCYLITKNDILWNGASWIWGESVFIKSRECNGGVNAGHVGLKKGALLRSFSPSFSKNSSHKCMRPWFGVWFHHRFTKCINADGPWLMMGPFRIFQFYNGAKAICIWQKLYFKFCLRIFFSGLATCGPMCSGSAGYHSF